MATQDPRPSPRVVALKDFSRYQINPDSSDNPIASAKRSFKSSTHITKINRKLLIQDNEMANLPGINEPLVQKDNPSFTEIEKTIREEEKAANTILLLGFSDKVKYFGLLLVFTFCRGALCPLMAMIPFPIVPKLVWRNLLLSAMLVPLVYSEMKVPENSLLRVYSEQKQLTYLFVTCSAFTIWVYCAIYASHHNDIGQIVALTSCQYLIIGLFRLLNGTSVSDSERKGIILGLVSILILVFWNSPSHTPHTYLDLGVFSYWDHLLHGNLIAFIGAAASSIYLVYSRKLWGSSVHFNNLNYTVFGLVIYFIVLIFFEGRIEEWEGVHEQSSFWSIFSLKLFLEMSLISLVTGLLPNVLYPSLMKVFDQNILGVAFVLQPVAALAIALILGLQSLPSIVVMIGIVMSIVSNFIVRREITATSTTLIAVEEDMVSVEQESQSVEQQVAPRVTEEKSHGPRPHPGLNNYNTSNPSNGPDSKRWSN